MDWGMDLCRAFIYGVAFILPWKYRWFVRDGVLGEQGNEATVQRLLKENTRSYAGYTAR